MSRPVGSRTHPPLRSFSSHRRISKTSPDYLIQLSPAIMPRDINICMYLYRHTCLSTHDITDLFFGSDHCCRKRLLKLKEYGLVASFRPPAERGSHPNHFVLGDLGAYVVAAQMGLEVKELGLRKDRLTSIRFSPKLPHLLAQNSFFCRLVGAARSTTDHQVAQWLSEREVGRRWQGIVQPDGCGEIHGPGRTCRFFFEMDLRTESLERLSRKLDGYRMAFQVDRPPDLILFCLPDDRREASVRRTFKIAGLPIATTTMARHWNDPLGPNWLLAASEERLQLLDLPSREKRAA